MGTQIYIQDLVSYGFSPIQSCGLGQNLYIKPDGTAYPCYALDKEKFYIGHINTNFGLKVIIESENFKQLSSYTVNTNLRCKSCSLRYLCGGLCKAWSYKNIDINFNDPPQNCKHLFDRANSIFLSTLEALNITEDHWLEADLSLPH